MLPSSQPPTELLRFRSAPCSLLDSLLQEPEPESLEQCLENLVNDSPSRKYGSGEREFRVFRNDTGPSRSSFDPGNHGRELGLHRLSSYPAELFAELDFTGNASGSSFSGLGISGDLGSGQSNLHFVQSNANKRARDSEEQQNSGHLKEEGEQGFQLSKGDSLDSKEMERLLEDSVPCGVRRTRISDRIRKLQELVPNMDKQTNTADKLEEAVEYVKFLQKQVKEKASLTGLSLGRNYQSIDFNANAPVQLIQILEPCSSENYKTVSISNKKEVFLSLYRTWLDPEARQKSETSRLMYSPIIPVKCIFLFAEG